MVHEPQATLSTSDAVRRDQNERTDHQCAAQALQWAEASPGPASARGSFRGKSGETSRVGRFGERPSHGLAVVRTGAGPRPLSESHSAIRNGDRLSPFTHVPSQIYSVTSFTKNHFKI